MARFRNKKQRRGTFGKAEVAAPKKVAGGSVNQVTGEKIPRSFVFSRGKIPGSLKHLQMDLRKLMLPHTALKLKIVLSGFGTGDEHLRLTTIMFQNIFPSIDINTVKLASCQRLVLLNYNKETKLIDFRHYSIRLQPVGVSRRIRKFVQNHQVPDLRSLQDVSEFVTKAGYGSESEADDEAATVNLASDLGRVNRASSKSAVRLQEIGPRMTLQLERVQEGLCSGAVIFKEHGAEAAEEVQEPNEED
ncbi:Peter Pan-like protein [Acorus gramineus]|uniref:Peter Pan-like protein n=1 Tax=Acorus gramineus TaxID=55184 RepID=A0AAV9BPE5_ACOGR|nr:Peter Pan-like protein [Acorus gramineus]